jgi:hypothetical protein
VISHINALFDRVPVSIWMAKTWCLLFLSIFVIMKIIYDKGLWIVVEKNPNCDLFFKPCNRSISCRLDKAQLIINKLNPKSMNDLFMIGENSICTCVDNSTSRNCQTLFSWDQVFEARLSLYLNDDPLNYE